MIFLYLLGALLAILILYFLFLGVCALLVSPDKTYEKNSLFYPSSWIVPRLWR